MSTSAGLEISAGSKSDGSCATGKLSVWSGASGSGDGVGLLLGVHAAAANTSSTSRATCRTRGRLPEAVMRRDVVEEPNGPDAADDCSVDLGHHPPLGRPDVDERDRAAEPH